MASKRKLRSAGTTTNLSLDTSKLYGYDSTGSIVEKTTVGDDDIVFSGSKSSLRRMADLERNLSILAAKSLTTDAGNASVTSASKWTTARTLSLSGDATGSVSIDGSGDATLSVVVKDNSHYHDTYPTKAGGGAYGTWPISIQGNAPYAASSGKWATGRYIMLSGDATGSVWLDGSADTFLSVTVADDSHNHVISNIDGLQAALDAKATPSDISTAISNLVNGANASFDTLKEIQDAMATDAELAAAISGLTIGNGTMTVSAGSGMTGGGSFTANQTGNSSVTISHADTSTVTNVDNSGNTFIQDLTFDGFGHVTGVASAAWSNAVSITGNAATATSATNATNASYVYVEDDNSTNATRYITFVDNSSAGNKRLNEDTGLYYNPSTNGLFVAGEITAYASDVQLKTNVVAIESPLAKLEAIRGVTYNWNEKGQEFGLGTAEQVGVIAQEVEAVLPQLVTQSAIEGYKTVKYDKLTALLIEAVKELNAEVKTLKARLGDSSL
jgi:hypothetical protein